MDIFMKPNNMTAQQAVKQHLMASHGAVGPEGFKLLACLYLGHLFSLCSVFLYNRSFSKALKKINAGLLS